jgi:phosphohistidine phosphatase
MDVCLVRHAIAVDRGTPGYEDDYARPLTADGRKRMELAAAGLAKLFVAEVILTSPLIRASQTAEVLHEQFQCPVKRCDALGRDDHSGVIEALRARTEARVALVGHEPWMSGLLAVLLTGSDDAFRTEFKKGAAALVSSVGPPIAGGLTLQWFMTPSALRRIGQSRG